MNIFFYIILFIIGSLFGSFYTLAVYRIPKKQDITHTRSYCPNCNHKLGFLDMFPIFSYILLGGKCRYCKQKIRPRYFILEILSGTLFVIMAYIMKLNIYNLELIKIIDYIFMVLYITFVILVAGIDKEYRKVEKSLNIYGIAISISYMVYLYILGNANIYRYVMYLILYIVILIIDTIALKRSAINSYLTGILLVLVTMSVFTQEYVVINTVIYAFLTIALYILIKKIKNNKKTIKKEKNNISKKVNMAFCLGVSNLVVFILTMYYINYIV